MQGIKWSHCTQCGQPLGEGAGACDGCGAAAHCPGCGAAAHCPGCGAAAHCPGCGAAIFPGMSYCGACGARIVGAGVDWRRVTYDGRRLAEWVDDLVSHDGGERVRAAEVIDNLGPEADGAVEELLGGLELAERWERLMPAESLLQIGRHVERAAEVIVDAMCNDPSEDVRMTAFGGLCKNGPKALPAVPFLIQALETEYPDDFREVHELAAIALGAIGPEAREAIPALTQASHSYHSKPRKEAEKALKIIQGEN